MRCGRGESVGRAHHGADVAVVLPVLDGYMERMPPGVQVGLDGFHGPVPVAVDNLAAVASEQQFGVEVVAGGPRQPMGVQGNRGDGWCAPGYRAIGIG